MFDGAEGRIFGFGSLELAAHVRGGDAIVCGGGGAREFAQAAALVGVKVFAGGMAAVERDRGNIVPDRNGNRVENLALAAGKIGARPSHAAGIDRLEIGAQPQHERIVAFERRRLALVPSERVRAPVAVVLKAEYRRRRKPERVRRLVDETPRRPPAPTTLAPARARRR